MSDRRLATDSKERPGPDVHFRPRSGVEQPLRRARRTCRGRLRPAASTTSRERRREAASSTARSAAPAAPPTGAKCRRAAVDVPADVVGVVCLQGGGPHRRAADDPLPEARCEPLHLGLDQLGRIPLPAVRDVTVGPCRVLSLRSPRRVEQALLRQQHERPRRDPAAPRRRLRGDDLLERRSQMHGPRARAFLGAPWDRPVERPVDLEDPRAVAEAAQPAAIAPRQRIPGQREQLLRRDVEQHRRRIAELGERPDAPARLDLAAERPQVAREALGDRLRAAASERPPGRMGEEAEKEAEGRRRRPCQRQHRVRGEPRKETPGLHAAERTSRHHAGRQRGVQRKPRHRREMVRPRHRSEQVLCQRFVGRRERRHQLPVAQGVLAERRRCLVDGANDERRRPVVEGMSERCWRLDPLDAVLGERHRAHERRGDPERVDRRADVVHEPGQRQLRRAAAAADRLLGFQHSHGQAGAGQHDRRAETVRTRADDNRFRHSREASRTVPGSAAAR